MPVHVDVVIPCWNGVSRLEKCVRSILDANQAGLDLRVLICDDGSTDGTSELAAGLAAEQEQVTHLRAERGGVNVARNRGVRASRSGSVVSFIDDDELVPASYFTRALALLDGHPDVGGVGGPYRTSDDPVRPRVCSRCRPGDMTINPEADGTSWFLLGGNAVLRRELFDSVGLFDDRLSGFGDETEWYTRASRQGVRFLYADELAVAHRRDQSTWWQVTKKAVAQGRSLPTFWRTSGQGGPRYARVPRALAHAILMRCSHAWRDAVTQISAIVEDLRLRVRRGR